MSEKIVLQVTYFRHNFGSVLQAFATKEFLQSFGLKTILVDCKLTRIERIIFGTERRFRYLYGTVRFPEIKKEREAQIDANRMSVQIINTDVDEMIDKFIATKLNKLESSYFKIKKYAKSDECAFCLAGSDQIWNGSRVFVNPIYFLTFSPRHKRIALAPSFGNNEIKNYNLSAYKNLIKKFAKLSAREKEGKSLIKKLCNRNAEWILDPVLLLTASEWSKVCAGEEKAQNNSFIFAFFLNALSEKAVSFLKLCTILGYRIVTLGYESNIKDLADLKIEVIIGGPETFIDLIQKAKIICTDSFHATVFSSIFHKTFYTFDRSYICSKQSARLTDFLRSINLIDRYDAEIKEIVMLDEKRFQLFDELAEKNRSKVIEFLEI